MNPLLVVDGLHVHYPSRQRGGVAARAVDGVNLDIRQGEIIALVGESGCGKTTLARAIVGLHKPSSGTISFAGDKLPTDSGRTKLFHRRVQIVFQDPTASINPRQSVYEIVAEGLRIHGLVENEFQEVVNALEQCGLHPAQRYMHKYPHELSGGQRQRVVIAGAMVLQPQILVADEPVSSLDASVRGEILGLLQHLARDKNMAVLVVTHDLGVPWNIADRIAVMYLGRIIEIGTTEEIIGDPRHPYTRALLSVVLANNDEHRQILKGEMPDPTKIACGCRFHPRCPFVQSGNAQLKGIEGLCTTSDPSLLNHKESHSVACHAVGTDK